MPIDENERRTKVLKKFARDINTKYTDKYTSDEDPRSFQKLKIKSRDTAPTKTENKSFDTTDFNCDFSKKVSYFEYGPNGVSKKDMVSKTKTYNSTNITTTIEPIQNWRRTSKEELVKTPQNTVGNDSKSYSSTNITSKAESTIKNIHLCDNENCGSHFEASRQ